MGEWGVVIIAILAGYLFSAIFLIQQIPAI